MPAMEGGTHTRRQFNSEMGWTMSVTSHSRLGH